jgi:hypothetical protein
MCCGLSTAYCHGLTLAFATFGVGVGEHTEMRSGGKSPESWFESLIGHSEMHMGISTLLMSEI